jgi:hypothetical protein
MDGETGKIFFFEITHDDEERQIFVNSFEENFITFDKNAYFGKGQKYSAQKFFKVGHVPKTIYFITLRKK